MGDVRWCLVIEPRSSSTSFLRDLEPWLPFHIINLKLSVNKMRVYNRLLATAADAGASKLFRPVPMALLPPIPLYRRLLRAHRKLPREERTLGDLYVKAEFHAHRDIDNPVHIVRLIIYYQFVIAAK